MAKNTTVIIAEKPDAAMHIAKALAEKGLKKRTSSYGVDYYTFWRGGKKHIVVAAAGHLFNLTTKDKGYPVFNVEWKPSFKVRRISAFSEKYFKTIEEVARGAGEYISAADYDNEGSLIAFNILRFICQVKDGKRMKFSTLAKPDIIESYKKMSPHLDWQNIEAGETRHHLDFMYGITTSRALMHAIKKYGKRFSILSAGRVQGPVLTLLAEKEKEISKFKPKPYWEIQLVVDIFGNKVTATYEKGKIWDKKEAEKILKNCRGKIPVIEKIIKKEYLQKPPAPFNITSLQTEAYKLFGYSPQQTLSYAQKLYTSAYTSYPRTSSEKLPPQINYRAILEAVARLKKYSHLVKKIVSQGELKPTEGKRTDPAHEAIHPTVEPPKRALTGAIGKIYDLIVRRYLAVFGKPAVRESIQLILKVGKYKFKLTGRRTLEKGWTEFYGPYAKADEIIFPEFKKGQKLKVKSIEKLSKETQPPPRYSQASIIKEMEKRGLGTRATRAAIMQTLYDRGYIFDKSIHVSDLGMKISEVLKKYVPALVDEKLTRSFETYVENIILKGKKKGPIIRKAKKALEEITNEFKKHEKEIGKKLSEAIIRTQEEQSFMGKCPDCGGDLKLLYSPFSKKHFIGCTNYNRCIKCGFTRKACKCRCPICSKQKGKCDCSWKEKEWTPKCQRGYPVPHGARITNLKKICPECGTTIIRVQRPGKRPFNMCLEVSCPKKSEWGKKDNKKNKSNK